MYNVMLIDDEASARKLMKDSIDWESLDMCVVGEAESGIEAINTIDDIKPDIAFVDIHGWHTVFRDCHTEISGSYHYNNDRL